jgi:predicted O-methyltransferase YrrM
MNIEKIRQRVDGIPHMTFAQAQVMTSVLLENKFQSLLELGFRHGVSTCYMAGALDERGMGSIVTIDLATARDAKPSVDELLADLKLSKYVTVYYEPTSYIWRLMHLLEEASTPRFDFCYIDGAHDWATDGFAFFLVDRLLQPGGLIIFDDIDWTYQSSPALKNTEKVRIMPHDERSTPQVRKIYELLVKPHPGYSDFMVIGEWAYARKRVVQSSGSLGEVRREVVYQKEYLGVGGFMLKVLRKLAR